MLDEGRLGRTGWVNGWVAPMRRAMRAESMRSIRFNLSIRLKSGRWRVLSHRRTLLVHISIRDAAATLRRYATLQQRCARRFV